MRSDHLETLRRTRCVASASISVGAGLRYARAVDADAECVPCDAAISLATASGRTVRIVAPDEVETIDVIAQRMRLTLVEVLGAARADEMFDHSELLERVHWHLDRSEPGRAAEVFVAEDATGRIVGHTMVRCQSGEPFEPGLVGLFATTYVEPGARRTGAASALLSRGEHWMRQHGLSTASTFTDPGNARLQALYVRHGYQWTRVEDTWMRAAKTLDPRAVTS